MLLLHLLTPPAYPLPTRWLPVPPTQVVQFVQGFVNRVLADLITFGFYSSAASGGAEGGESAAGPGAFTGAFTDKDGAFQLPSDSSVRVASALSFSSLF